MEILNTKAAEGEDPTQTTWFFYGPTGTGKTIAASTFPAPLFMIPANEGSHMSLRSKELPYTIIGKKGGKRVQHVRKQVMANLQELRKMATEMLAYQTQAWEAHDAGDEAKAEELFAAADEAFPYQTIVLESLTHLTELVVEEISDTGTTTRGSMDQAKWGELATFYRNVHNALRSLPVHVVYTALDTWDPNAEVGSPYISGKTSSVLPSSCDVVGYFESKTTVKNGTVYRVHFKDYRKRVARTRFDRLPAAVDNFNFESLRKKGLFRA